MPQQDKISTIQKAWNQLGSGNLEVLEEIYAADILFEDPIAVGRGMDALKQHLGRLPRSLRRMSYSYGGSTRASGIIVIEWTLHAEVRSTGKAFELPGISWLQLDPDSGKIERSREYFDLGKALYEQIPVVGYFIKAIKRHVFPRKLP